MVGEEEEEQEEEEEEEEELEAMEGRGDVNRQSHTCTDACNKEQGCGDIPNSWFGAYLDSTIRREIHDRRVLK